MFFFKQLTCFSSYTCHVRRNSVGRVGCNTVRRCNTNLSEKEEQSEKFAKGKQLYSCININN